MNIRKSSFHPNCEMKDKHNFKPYNLIERDGTIYERIFLDVPDPSFREYLICMHYLKHQVKVFGNRPLGLNIISRDDPWDFKIETSEKEEFNIEITAIADDDFSFEKMKREERLAIKSNEEKLPIHELIKLNSFFPTEKMSSLIENLLENGHSKKDIVENPFRGNYPNIFLSNSNYTEKNLENLMNTAISKKESKKHREKDKTVLLIDNRTLKYEISDFFEAFKAIEKTTDKSNFREIWLYTGYCSDNDGNNAEYSLAPIKITEKQNKKLIELTNKNKPNENGVVYV